MQLSQGHDLQFRANSGCTYSVFNVKITRHNFLSNLQTTKSGRTNYQMENNQQKTRPPFFLTVTLIFFYYWTVNTMILLFFCIISSGMVVLSAGFKHSMSRFKEGVDHRCLRTALSSNGLTPLQMARFHIFNLDLLLFWYDLPLVHQT